MTMVRMILMSSTGLRSLLHQNSARLLYAFSRLVAPAGTGSAAEAPTAQTKASCVQCRRAQGAVQYPQPEFPKIRDQ